MISLAKLSGGRPSDYSMQLLSRGKSEKWGWMPRNRNFKQITPSAFEVLEYKHRNMYRQGFMPKLEFRPHLPPIKNPSNPFNPPWVGINA